MIAQSAKSSYDLASSLARSIGADAVPGKFGVVQTKRPACGDLTTTALAVPSDTANQ